MKKILLTIFTLNFLLLSINLAFTKEEKKMEITSSAFKHNENIPSKYTCDGDDFSPPLNISNIPEETKSLAIIADDPDAPKKTWVHWVIFNIPPDQKRLQEGIQSIKELPNEAIQGTNDFEKIGYGGPCPPSGIHRYFFKLYALDTIIKLESGITKKELEEAIKSHILDQAELIGTYKRN